MENYIFQHQMTNMAGRTHVIEIVKRPTTLPYSNALEPCLALPHHTGQHVWNFACDTSQQDLFIFLSPKFNPMRFGGPKIFSVRRAAWKNINNNLLTKLQFPGVALECWTNCCYTPSTPACIVCALCVPFFVSRTETVSFIQSMASLISRYVRNR